MAVDCTHVHRLSSYRYERFFENPARRPATPKPKHSPLTRNRGNPPPIVPTSRSVPPTRNRRNPPKTTYCMRCFESIRIGLCVGLGADLANLGNVCMDLGCRRSVWIHGFIFFCLPEERTWFLPLCRDGWLLPFFFEGLRDPFPYDTGFH